MVLTLEQAARKWGDRTIAAKDKWRARTAVATESYRAGIARFLGIGTEQVSSGVADRFRRGVEAVTPEEFAAAVRGRETEWASGYRAGVTERYER